MGRGDLRGSWLTFRRVVAVAELIGLPQANDTIMHASGTSNKPAEKLLMVKADLWEAICATDRNFALMLNLPIGTARYHFPRNQSIWRNGNVSPQAYNYLLSNICATVFDIDEAYLRGGSDATCYEKVLSADRQLRALATSAPRLWWDHNEGAPLPDLLVKFWHNYIMARVHLRPGMMNDFDEQYEYSRSACRTACENTVRRFPGFRASIPSGFFVCQVIDVQVFTAATFLLLSGNVSQQGNNLKIVPEIIHIVQQVIDCFASVSHQAGSGLAREAMSALTSLMAIAQGKRFGEATSLSLQIPMLGKVHITTPITSCAGQASTLNEDTLSEAFVPFEPMSWLFEPDSQDFALML
nr:putative transcription factor gsfr1 [Quercus suber]